MPIKESIKCLAPSSKEFVNLRVSIGWSEVNLDLVETSLKNSLFHVTIRLKDELIAMGRVIGDGSMFYYVQDVVVHPDYQGRGYGHQIMVEIESYISQNSQKGSTVGLLSVKGKESFYTKYGYSSRDGEVLGFGMCKFI